MDCFLKLPLFSGLSSWHERKIQTAKVFSAEKLSRYSLLTLKSEVDTQFQNLNEGYEIVTQNKAWVEAAVKAYKNGRKHFLNGRISTFQIVQLQGLKERAQLNYLQSLQEIYTKFLAFQILLGQDLESFYGG